MRWVLLFLLGGWLFSACGSTDESKTTERPSSKLLAKLSPSTLQALNSGMRAQCACIQTHQAQVDSLMATLEPLNEGLAMGTIRDAGEAGMIYIRAMQQAEKFNICLTQAVGPESEEELKAAEKELDQLFAELNDEQQLDRLLDIYGEIARKECPEGAKIIQLLHQLQQQILRLQAN